MIKIMLADDQQLVREALAALSSPAVLMWQPRFGTRN